MGMLVDIRKFHMDMWTNELYDASKFKRNWWGKKVDNYWAYLDNTMQQVDCTLDAHIMADLFVYLYEKCAFKEMLSDFIEKIAANRGSFISKLIVDDKVQLLQILSEPLFIINLKIFLKDLNGEFYNYEDVIILDTVDEFKRILCLINEEYGLLINIG